MASRVNHREPSVWQTVLVDVVPDDPVAQAGFGWHPLALQLRNLVKIGVDKNTTVVSPPR